MSEQIAPTPADVLKTLAQTLGVSARTIQRRYQAEGSTFRVVRDKARRERAIALLSDPTQSVTQISIELGFGKTTSFCRAVRRWYGLSPM